jgi:Tfp pilus assembly protein PilN
MRAVNLIPVDARGRGRNRGPSTGMALPTYVLLGFLAAAVALVTVYVLTNNSISSRTAKLNNLKTQVSQEQAAAARLGEFTKFASLAQTRISTVRSIAAARFDWHAALSDLSKVVPANTTLQSVNGSVVPGASAGGAGGGGALRSDITAPAFELTGCTASQDDVARLISQLRLINGVTRVSFSNSQATGSSGSGVGGSSQGCGSNGPTFDLIVFFQPVANAGASGVTSIGAVSTTATTPGGTQ